MTDLGPALSKGEAIDIPSQAKPTNAGVAAADPQSLLPTADVLTVDQEVFYNIEIPRRESAQLLNSRWPAETARAAQRHHKNEVDDNLINFIYSKLGTVAEHINVAADDLDDKDGARAEARLLKNDGVDRSDLMYILSAHGIGNIQTIADYVPSFTGSERGLLGVPAVTAWHGIPVFTTNGIGSGRVVPITGFAAVGGGVFTATVATGHGLVNGLSLDVVSTAPTTDLAVTISVVTATSFDFTSGGTPTGTGTGTIKSEENLLVDRTRIFTARQEDASVETVKAFRSPASALQIYSLFGRQTVANAAIVLHSPFEDV